MKSKDISYTFLTKEEERIGQFSRRKGAEDWARREHSVTGLPHRVCLTTTYRNLIPRVCWTVVFGTPGRGDKFQLPKKEE